MSKVLTDQIEKRTGGTAMDVPATGRWAATSVGDGTVSDTEFTYINSLTSNAQTQITDGLALKLGLGLEPNLLGVELAPSGVPPIKPSIPVALLPKNFEKEENSPLLLPYFLIPTLLAALENFLPL